MGIPFAGWLSDHTVKTWRKLRDGKWVPEDRLRATWYGGLYLVPLPTVIVGFVIQFFEGSLGLVFAIGLLLTHGIGV